MRKNTLTRRELFTKIFKSSIKKLKDTDPLFKKYSRKIYNGRKYLAPSEVNKTSVPQNLLRVNPVTSGLNVYTGTWTDREAIHLLKRTGFGFRKSDLDVITTPTMNAASAVDLILNINAPAPAPPVNNYEPDEPDENNLAYGVDWTNNPFVDNDFGSTTNSKRLESLTSWMTGLALNQDITIKEKMTLFWYHFIPVDFTIVSQSSNEFVNTNSARVCYQYMKMFRDNPAGNFKALIRNMSTQPAMMFYLNNQANSKNAPDENFAREIMELFTLGKGSNSQYSQPDVIQAAKLLTGWRVRNLNTTNVTTEFVPNRHDESNKQFSPFFNNTIIPFTGASELDAFIDMIFTKSEVVSQYICRRLYRFFVYYDIDANIETNVIVPLAQHFVNSNWNIMPVLERLFKSQHFFDMANKGVYIKSPFDLMYGFIRTFNVNHNVSDPTNHNAQYDIWNTINYLTFDMEQAMGLVPNPSGWQAFYQNPSFHEYWINANSIQKRFAYIAYAFYGIDFDKNGLTTKLKADTLQFVSQFPNATCQDPNLLVSECIKYLLPLDLSQQQKDLIKAQTLLAGSGQTTDYYWTLAWDTYKADTSNQANKLTVTSRLDGLFLTIIQLAEFQLM